MKVWAIADLHLSLGDPLRLERERKAGRKTEESATRIAAEWRSVVRETDLVLMPGDLSMARDHRRLQPDLAWLDRLPGIKIIAPGNHDRWWNGVDRIRPLLRKSIRAVCGDALKIGDAVVCGARGSIANREDTDRPDKETSVLKRAIEQAEALRVSGNPLYVLWHYPPFDVHGAPGLAADLIQAAKATVCVYGHLHARDQWMRATRGVIGGTRFELVAAEAVGYRPLLVDRLC